MAFDVDICNGALVHVGHTDFLTSSSDTSIAAQVCDKIYEQTRNSTLKAFPWPFCTRRSTLALLAYSRTGFANAYALPPDCLSPRYLFNGFRPGGGGAWSPGWELLRNNAQVLAGPLPQSGYGGLWTPFAVETGDAGVPVLLADVDGAELVYTAKVEDPHAFPADFTEALQYALAVKLARAIVKKEAIAQAMFTYYRAELARASAAALRESKDDGTPEGSTISARW